MLNMFKNAVIIFQSIFFFVKIYLTAKHSPNAAGANEYPTKIAMFQGIHAILLLLPFLWGLNFLEWDLIMLSFPGLVKWFGLINYVLIIGLVIWQMRHLSVNISASHDERFLVNTGPYKYVRHPLYLIFVLIMLNCWLISGNLIFIGATIIAFIASKVRADFEEQLLINEYGDAYLSYQKQVPQLIPIGLKIK